jgi:anti-anti-sigma factor
MTSDMILHRESLGLSGDLDIYSARSLKASLLSALEGRPALQLDLSAVSNIDAAGLQVLALLHREAGRAGKTLRISGASETLLGFIESVGMHNLFDGALASGGRKAAA